MPDLWPEIGVPNIRTPVSVLREQASLLGAKTNNVLEGDVTKVDGAVHWAVSWEFIYVFHIVAPLLKDFRYRLLSIAHRIDMYPLRVRLSEELVREITDAGAPFIFNSYYVAETENEEAFMELIRLTLNSAKTMKIIHSLLAQSQT